MKKNHVYTLSCRVREMNTDLLPIFFKMRDKGDITLSSFIRDTNKHVEPKPLFSTTADTLDFDKGTESVSSAICNDIAMRAFLPEREENVRQVLLCTPNNFFYQLAMKPYADDEPKRLDLQKFSHILAPNNFIKEVLASNFHLDDNQTLALTETPFHWNLRQEEEIQQKRESFFTRYPQAKNKKILFWMVPQKTSKAMQKKLEQYSLPKFLKKLESDWLLVTNCKALILRTLGNRKDYSQQMLYINSQYPLEDVLHVCDLLITDLGFFAVAQAHRKKPFLCIGHNGNPFEKYIQKNHPTLFLKTLDDFLSLADLPSELTKEHEALYQDLVFQQEDNPIESIQDLLLFE